MKLQKNGSKSYVKGIFHLIEAMRTIWSKKNIIMYRTQAPKVFLLYSFLKIRWF